MLIKTWAEMGESILLEVPPTSKRQRQASSSGGLHSRPPFLHNSAGIAADRRWQPSLDGAVDREADGKQMSPTISLTKNVVREERPNNYFLA